MGMTETMMYSIAEQWYPLGSPLLSSPKGILHSHSNKEPCVKNDNCGYMNMWMEDVSNGWSKEKSEIYEDEKTSK